MASPVPAKSQPLHNFSLPHLKWKKNHTNNHHRGRSRLAADSSPLQSPSRQSPLRDAAPRQSPMRDSAPRRSPMHDAVPRQSPMREPVLRQSPMRESAPRQSPMRDSASESESGYAVTLKKGFVPENRKNSLLDGVKTGFSVVISDSVTDRSEKVLAMVDSDVAGGKEVRSKIYIRLRKNKPDDVQGEEKPDEVQDEGRMGTVDGEVEESVPKTWNLRPRKPLRKQPIVNGGTSKVENKAQVPQFTLNRSESEANAAEKKEKKQKFSISLSREEIEEDIFSFTGSKPARRPKKRAKTIQKQLDNLFPGLWLALISPDSYKVYENPPKV